MSTPTGKVYVVKDGERLGPFRVDELLEQVDCGAILYEDFCLRHGERRHVPVREVLDWNDEDWNSSMPPADDEADAGWQEDGDSADDGNADSDDARDGEREIEGGPPQAPWPQPSPRRAPRRKDRPDLSDPAAQLYCGHPSLLSYPGSLILALAGLLTGGLLWTHNGWFLFGGMVLALLCFGYVQFDRSMRKYIITPRRVEIVHGFLARNSNEVRIGDIRAINVRKPGFIGLLGVGNVEFASAGSDTVEVEFTRVSRPDKIKGLVRRLQDRK